MLMMLSGGRPAKELEEVYYARMFHVPKEREECEQIFSRNVQFVKYYLETLDDDGKLLEKYREEASDEKGAQGLLFRRSLENILAFQVLMDCTKHKNFIDQKTLQRCLAEDLLKRAKVEFPEEYEKKVKNLQINYGSEQVWVYPWPSLDRLLEIARLGALVTREKGRIKIEYDESRIKEGSHDEMSLEDFGIKVHSLYHDFLLKSNDRIVSIDPFRTEFCTKYKVTRSIFDRLFNELVREDDSLTSFSGKIGNEEGIELDTGRFVYRFTLQ